MITCMLIDSSSDMDDMLIAMFELWEMDGIAFLDGDDAVRWIEAVDAGKYSGKLPDLALLDVILPGVISGVELSKRLRQSSVLGNMAIILMTAYKYSPVEESDMMKRSGADKLLYKPLPKFQTLRYILEQALQVRLKAGR